MTKNPDGVELALYHALRYELALIQNADTKLRWDPTQPRNKNCRKMDGK